MQSSEKRKQLPGAVQDSRQAPGLRQHQDRGAVHAGAVHAGPGPWSGQARSDGASSAKCELPEKEPGLSGEGRAGRGLRVSIRASTCRNTDSVGESQDRTWLLDANTVSQKLGGTSGALIFQNSIYVKEKKITFFF